jgi:hypothetical protein
MTFAGSMHAGEDRVHDTNRCVTSDAVFGDAIADAYAAVGICRRLERTNNGCANGNDMATF